MCLGPRFRLHIFSPSHRSNGDHKEPTASLPMQPLSLTSAENSSSAVRRSSQRAAQHQSDGIATCPGSPGRHRTAPERQRTSRRSTLPRRFQSQHDGSEAAFPPVWLHFSKSAARWKPSGKTGVHTWALPLRPSGRLLHAWASPAYCVPHEDHPTGTVPMVTGTCRLVRRYEILT